MVAEFGFSAADVSLHSVIVDVRNDIHDFHTATV